MAKTKDQRALIVAQHKEVPAETAPTIAAGSAARRNSATGPKRVRSRAEKTALRRAVRERLAETIAEVIAGRLAGLFDDLEPHIKATLDTAKTFEVAGVSKALIANATLSKAETAVFDEAHRVIGDRNEAMRWMGTPVRALDYATPVSLVGMQKGRDAVFAVLSRLEHGVL